MDDIIMMIYANVARDASFGPSSFHLSLLDCFRGLHKVLKLNDLNIDLIKI